MTRFITYCDPAIAALEAQRQQLLRRLDVADAALETAEPDTLTAAFYRSLIDSINRGLDDIADRIAAREAQLDNPD